MDWLLTTSRPYTCLPTSACLRQWGREAWGRRAWWGLEGADGGGKTVKLRIFFFESILSIRYQRKGQAEAGPRQCYNVKVTVTALECSREMNLGDQ